jgi:DNA polymerase-3 subunit alpha
MKEYLKKLKPTSLSDLSAMNALYRPGPMDFIDDFIDRKFGRKEAAYLHPVLEPLLKETYGIIVYQEQVIQIANKVAGMSLAEADILRRAMGKKDLKAMENQKVIFVEGAVKNGIPKKTAEDIFEAINKFANYGFNKSHSVAYSYIAYQTAYLKAHFTPEFLAANLTNEFGNANKVAAFLEDCRKLKIEILPADVNNPSVDFDVDEKGRIRFGMSAVKNVGKNAVEEIIKTKNNLERNFKSIFDFCSNVDTRVVNKRTIESLVLAGAFDSINQYRARLFDIIEQALDFGSKVQNSKLSVENSLFGGIQEEVKISEPQLPAIEPWSQKERLAREREVAGFYITGHPLRKYEIDHKSFATISLGETEQLEEVDVVKSCGVITSIKTKLDKKGNTMAFFTLDDFSGSCEALMFSDAYKKFGKYIKEEECIFIVGRPESSGDAIKIHIEKVMSVEEARETYTESVKIRIDKEKHSPEKIKKLKDIFERNKGNFPIFVTLSENGSAKRKFSLREFRVNVSNEFIIEMQEILGEDSVVLINKR